MPSQRRVFSASGQSLKLARAVGLGHLDTRRFVLD
jgi:hypothetical protein